MEKNYTAEVPHMIYLFTWAGGRLHGMQTIEIGKRLMVCAADCCDCGGDHGLVDVVLAAVWWRVVAVVVSSVC